jgi:hypothetical protein
MRKRLPPIAAAALILAGCNSMPWTGAAVDVPVTVPCVRATDVPARPTLMADVAWATDANPFQRARALLVDRLLLIAHADRLESLIRACVE